VHESKDVNSIADIHFVISVPLTILSRIQAGGSDRSNVSRNRRALDRQRAR